MTAQPMKGVRVLEVAQFTFTPSAGAVLSDWGADVIKVEHAVTGDAQRGLKLGTGGAAAGSFQPLMEHPNRGKRSIGLALEVPEAHEILMELAKEADVFLTNFLPAARRRLKIEVEDLRAANPDIIYVRGSALGQKGPEGERGGYDGSEFWARGGCASGCTPSDAARMIRMPAGAFGDSMGGMTIAGGIAAALFARERTGEPSIVDVSLLGVATWATALSVGNALVLGEVAEQPPHDSPMNMPVNPLIGDYKTKDNRWVTLTMLQPGRYWADTCRHLGLDHLIEDPRFDSAEKLMANADEAGAYLGEVFRTKTLVEWREVLATLDGQWAPNQNALELAHDPQVVANGYVLPVEDAEGHERFLASSPVQFDEEPLQLRRAPQFAEHTDEIVTELGRDEEALINLKIAGAIT